MANPLIETINLSTLVGSAIGLALGGFGGYTARGRWHREEAERLARLKEEIQEASDRKIEILERKIEDMDRSHREAIVRYHEINVKLARAVLYYENLLKEKGIEVPQSITTIIGITRTVGVVHEDGNLGILP